MAIDQHGDEILHSLYGRKFGLDKAGHAAGLAGVRVPVESSTAATALTPYGVSAIGGTTATYTLAAPSGVGVTKFIVNVSTDSTAQLNVVRSSSDSGVTFNGSTGAGGVNIALVGRGAAVNLIAISSAIWAVAGTATYATTAQGYVTVSTSS
jgi:hypothetical protein